ncbi:alkaline phosphatase family protein [Streptomyces montanisoli]|uniref:alkaline phosphatase family protein n=1 Tax=Streptomyces montanisoli TaxID=2798581 RepID=UPI001FD7EF9F|nr:alkaline phosphatase family protein [Streptomyces montanisoli]
MSRPARGTAASLTCLAAATGLWASPGAAPSARAATTVPTPDHVVVVVMENHADGQIIGSSSAPYINSLKSGGAYLSSSYAVTHPSQPNYFALFSGSTQGITDDSCYSPGFTSAANLGSELAAAGQSFASYNESLPSQGSTVCSSGEYARKHNPWFGFTNVPTSTAHTFKQFPTDYTRLPKVSFVIPNLCDDMHDCSVSKGDTWLKDNLGPYAAWARTHNSLLVLTFDEDDSHSGNRIPTLFYGQPVTVGSSSSTRYTHYSVLRTLEDMYGTGHAGRSADAADITGIWAAP